MERIAVESRWQSEKWQLAGVLPAVDAARTVLVDRPGLLQVRHSGYSAELFKDEAEGYYLNVVSPDPRVFVAWRMDEEANEAVPHRITLSYNEAARWMDAQESVDSVPLTPDLLAALAEWVQANYTPPEKKQRVRPQSFESKEGRYKGTLK
ncbi:MAG: DUF3305 domain-containing protein [Betaproteobacteria bacterium]|nr:DUF3305 domain-containing protein [Betaproteobacteria bacterium]